MDSFGKMRIVSLVLLLMVRERVLIQDSVNNYEVTEMTIVSSRNIGLDTDDLRGTIDASFEAFGRVFNLSLQKDESLISPNIQLDIKEELSFDHFEIAVYEGKVEGEISDVCGYFKGEIFVGSIRIDSEMYYTEAASDYLNGSFYGNEMLIYKGQDIIYPEGGCQNRSDQIFFPLSNQSQQHVATDEERIDSTEGNSNICGLEIIADQTFFKDTNYNIRDTITAMLYHIKSVNFLSKEIGFGVDEISDEIGFVVDKITIFEEENFEEVASPKELLEKLSLYVNKMCLVILFTHRELLGGIVGMSYAANAKVDGAVGGICQKPLVLPDNRLHSLNVIFVSNNYHGRRLLKEVVNNVLFHELGHSFGYHHRQLNNTNDFNPEYPQFSSIMSASCPNDHMSEMFTPDSEKSIRDVINLKGTCLKRVEATCGNGLPEEGEECDCGSAASCHNVDICCTPKGGLGPDKECTIRRSVGYVCSSRQSACCNDNCTIALSADKVKCGMMGVCQTVVFCDGKSAECPADRILPDGTACLDGGLTCNFGECNSTVCKDHKLKDCKCSEGSGKECHVCCIDTSGYCRSAADLGYYAPDGKIYMKGSGMSCSEPENATIGSSDLPQSGQSEVSPFFFQTFFFLLLNFPFSCN